MEPELPTTEVSIRLQGKRKAAKPNLAGPGYTVVKPPSDTNTAPVTKDASSLARCSIVYATSMGSANRFRRLAFR